MSTRLFWVFLFISIRALSQQTAIYTDPERGYQLGMELFNKQKFVVAQREFQKVLESTAPLSLEARGNAAFYSARCAVELFHRDAEYLMLNFMNEYPENPHYDEANYHLGNLYFKQKKFKKAVETFSKLDKNDLTQERRDEVNFKLGYSYYMTNDYDKASKAFYEVKDGTSKYATAAQYYYAHMAYVNENYETALNCFLKLKDSEAFAPVVPYYITQIYYKQGKYDEVLRFAPTVLDSVGPKNGMEIGRMVAESYYRKGKYNEALPYLVDYERNSRNVGRNDYYQLGYCYYKTSEFEKAIPYFQKVCTAADELSQSAYYHLADCYLKTNAKRSARTAYQSAAQSSFDTEIQEESQFNFAKLSYELSYQSVAIEAFRNFTTSFPKSAHLDEANELMVGIYTNTRNYKDALTSIEAIKNKTQPIRAAYQKVAYYRGIEFFMDNNLKEAIRLFKLSVGTPVDQGLVAEALYWMGETYYKMDDFENAAKAYNDYILTPAAVTQSQYNLANYNIGYAKFKSEDYAAAQTAFRKYVKEKSQTDNARYTDALLRIADCFFMLKDQASAIDFYNQAIGSNAKASDYGIYQKGVILGIQGRMAEKVATLQKLFDKYPKSVYYDDALYEAAQASLIIGNNEQALNYYQEIIRNYPSGSYMKKAELGEALVYYNEKEDDKAMAAYKKVVQKYPNTTESHEALEQIRKISVSQNKVDEYLAYAQNVPNADVSKAAQDSLMYEAAELRYTQGNCDDAVKDFDAYLKKFPNAIFLINASYYKSDCLYRNKQYEKALEGYEVVNNQPKNQFSEKSLLSAGQINYRLKNYQRALTNFEMLEGTAEVKDNIMAAQAGELRCSYKLNDYDKAISNSQKVLNSGATDKDLITEAHFIAGKSYFAKNDMASAKSELSIVAKRTNSEMTAESKYHLALIEFRMDNYKESQKLIFEIQNQVPSYDFWIAKGFILLGDNYLAQRDTFQARETYKSIVDNFQKDPNDSEDLKEVAKQKLDAINASESKKEKELMDKKLVPETVEPDSTEEK
ncbi:MAG: tetratricopeptide repeat protein [Bacteroidia bacterium]